MTLAEAIKQATERMNEPGRPAHYVIVKNWNADDYDWIPAAYLDDISYAGSRHVVEHLRRKYDPVQVLAGKQAGNRDEAVQDLAMLVRLESTYGDPDWSLIDWIQAGDYTGDETVNRITAEWDERQ